MAGDALLAAPVLRPGGRGRELYLPAGVWYDYWTGERVTGGRLLWAEAPLDRVPLYLRGGSVIPSTEAMNYVGEKAWDPLCFEVYPDAAGAAAGSLYEDDGVSPAYRDGGFRRTAVSCGRSAEGGVQLRLDAPAGRYAPGTRQFEFTVHGTAGIAAVTIDGRPLTALPAGDGAMGWWRDDAGAVHVRIADDSQAHVIQLR
jgi:alpha-glucosidase